MSTPFGPSTLFTVDAIVPGMSPGNATVLLLFTTLAAGCAPPRAEVAEAALLALERDGAEGLTPYLTRDARRFVESLDLSGFAPGAPGAPIECAEEEGAEDSGWRWVSCVQDGRRLRVAVVDTGRGPRLDLFRWSFEPFTGVPGEAVTGGLP